MAKDKRRKHHGLIADYVDDEYEQKDDDYAEYQEWKRRREEARRSQSDFDYEIDSGRRTTREDDPYDYEPEDRPVRRQTGSGSGQRRPASDPGRRQTRTRSSASRSGSSRPSRAPQQRRNSRPVRKKKKRHPFRFLFRVLILVILIFVAWTLISMAGLGTGSSVRNYLLIGQDRREGEGTERSDSMIIASINKDTKTITLTSLMRDMYVDIPGHDKNRLNAAYELGGMELLDQTIEEALDIEIDGNAEVDFDGFISAMTAVGNLDIELKDYEAEYLNVNSSYGGVENYAWSLTPGMNSLTPQQALAYSRIRYVGNSDWERTERQRTVITTAFAKLKSSGPITMIRVAAQIIPNLTTDMNPGKIMALAATVGFGGYDIGETCRVPFDGMYEDVTLDSGAMVLAPDLEANKAKLHEILYGGDAS